MIKIFTIASREYNAVIRSKAFVISIILLPVMMFGSVMVGKLSERMRDEGQRKVAVIDHTANEQIYAGLSRTLEQNADLSSMYVLESVKPAVAAEADRQRLALSERVRRGSLAGILEIGAEVPTAVTPQNWSTLSDDQLVRFSANSPTVMAFRDWAAREINRIVRGNRLAALNLPEDRVREIQSQVAVLNRGLSRLENGQIKTSEPSKDVASFLIPFGLVFLMFIVVVIGAVPMLQGIVEEKQQRIAEVLLGSVNPFQLMAGKVLGIVATSFTMILVYLGGAYWAAHRLNMGEYLSLPIIAWFLVFQLLAVLMYGSLYIAIGAACTDTKEMQSLLMPVNLLMAIPLMLILPILMSPRGMLARVMTWFPPATPFVSVARLAIPPGMSIVEAMLAIVIVLITTIALIWASGRIFRVGILMQGKGANLGQIAKWVLRG